MSHLPGTSWSVTAYNNGKGAVTTVVTGSDLPSSSGRTAHSRATAA